MTRFLLVSAAICVLSMHSTACGMPDEDGHCPFPQTAELVDYDHPARYVEQGPATQIVEGLGEAVSQARGWYVAKTSRMSAPEFIDRVIHQHMKMQRDPSMVLVRSASQVWKSGFASGCHDMALLAAAFLRFNGLPTVFVETVHDSYLRGESFHGHVFLEVRLANGDWMLYDPTNSRFWYDWTPGSLDLPGGYHVMGRYRDPWEADLGSNRDLMDCMAMSKETM